MATFGSTAGLPAASGARGGVPSSPPPALAPRDSGSRSAVPVRREAAVSPRPAPSRRRVRTAAAALAAATALGAVFLLYLRPDMAFTLATRLWACF